MMRIHKDIYDHLKDFPRRLVIPHRLNPYPSDVRRYPYEFSSLTPVKIERKEDS